MRFRANMACDVTISHLEIVLFEKYKTKIHLDSNGLNPMNAAHAVSQSVLYVKLRKPYYYDI